MLHKYLQASQTLNDITEDDFELVIALCNLSIFIYNNKDYKKSVICY